MEKTIERTIGQIVADDYRSAAVFEKFGIDFCCNGNRSIEAACEQKEVKVGELKKALETALTETTNATTDYNSWPLDLLADYIEKKHHRYVEAKIPVLKQYLDKIVKVHGAQHPELQKINELFMASAGEFTMHMKKEELMLFPFIRKMVRAQNNDEPLDAPRFGTVKNPIQTMMHEHDNEGENFRQIEALSNNYTPPTDGCNTYKVTFALLKEFQDDLHIHIHLENNILFPKAEELEKQLESSK
ncbi:iron-sulfur cluster repair di-iron protein [Flavobacteriaceae bacterium F89]|uniref:Iron-sulfur cluster repair di-iron protein n=1 Tax=Cerina litoralis TaxID=2874477 RepID=A0AAE3EZK7_9FLAO|nr:iron-sulfur cluster repair di-iron protein [Cerina litoralis]MCG2462531.1 iron-sulfur cluster repair di-iron protein [Cerina litoralis]